MCLNPIKLVNPKKRISLQGGQLFSISVPCGKCAECKKAAQSEWYFRTYYEAQDTYDSNGYVYFDTLTYNNEELPHISEFVKLPEGIDDHSCFDVRDYRNFFCQLREEWHRLYKAGMVRGDSRENLKYFLTSEYGTSDEGTHRPHYHVLFFVKNNAIDPLILSKLVHKCWHKGRTDGIDFHPYHYVMNHVFGPKYNSDMLHLQAVCNYVSKYVTKESHFEEVVDKRLNQLFIVKYGEDWRDDDATRSRSDRFKLLKKNMSQFHRQSHGFGENFLKYNDYEEVFKTGMISMPDKHSIVKHIPLPNYYQYKIFYDLVKDFQGRAKWELNEEGKKYKLVHTMKSIEIMAQKIEDWTVNMRNHNYYCSDPEWYDNIIGKFDELNDGRSLVQFALYLLVYKGRIKSPAQREREKNGIFRVDDAVEFFVGSMDEVKQFGPQLYHYGTSTDSKIFGTKFVTDKWLGDIHDYRDPNVGMSYIIKNWSDYVGNTQFYAGYTPDIFRHNKGKKFGNLLRYSMFEYKYVINDKSDERFKHYDEMYDLYCRGQYYKNEFKQSAHDEKEDVKFRLSRFTKRTI